MEGVNGLIYALFGEKCHIVLSEKVGIFGLVYLREGNGVKGCLVSFPGCFVGYGIKIECRFAMSA